MRCSGQCKLLGSTLCLPHCYSSAVEACQVGACSPQMQSKPLLRLFSFPTATLAYILAVFVLCLTLSKLPAYTYTT
jgi:hypothetical protein